MSELSNILNQLLEELAREIKAKTPRVTGKTAEAIEVKVTNPGNDLFVRVKGELLGPAYMQTLEDGRGPTRKGTRSGKSMRESILEWIEAKGFSFPMGKIKNAQQLSWAIAIKIHKEGNKLYRNGGKSGVLSTPLSDSRIENFIEVFNSKASRIMLEQVVKTVMK